MKVYYRSLNEGNISAVVVQDGPMLLLKVTAVSKRFFRKGMLVAAPHNAVLAR